MVSIREQKILEECIFVKIRGIHILAMNNLRLSGGNGTNTNLGYKVSFVFDIFLKNLKALTNPFIL